MLPLVQRSIRVNTQLHEALGVEPARIRVAFAGGGFQTMDRFLLLPDTIPGAVQ